MLWTPEAPGPEAQTRSDRSIGKRYDGQWAIANSSDVVAATGRVLIVPEPKALTRVAMPGPWVAP